MEILPRKVIGDFKNRFCRHCFRFYFTAKIEILTFQKKAIYPLDVKDLFCVPVSVIDDSKEHVEENEEAAEDVEDEEPGAW